MGTTKNSKKWESNATSTLPSVAKLPAESSLTSTTTLSPKPLKTSEPCAPVKKASATPAPVSTESSQTSCAKAATLPDTTALAASLFTAKNSLTKTLLRSTLSQVCFLWLIVDPTLMVRSFLSQLWFVRGWTESIAFLEKLLKAWMLFESAKLRVHRVVLRGHRLRLLLLVSCKLFCFVS